MRQFTKLGATAALLGAIAFTPCRASMAAVPVSPVPQECQGSATGSGVSYTLNCTPECTSFCASFTAYVGQQRYAFCACSDSEPADVECCTIVLLLFQQGTYPASKGDCSEQDQDCPMGNFCDADYTTSGGEETWLSECITLGD